MMYRCLIMNISGNILPNVLSVVAEGRFVYGQSPYLYLVEGFWGKMLAAMTFACHTVSSQL